MVWVVVPLDEIKIDKAFVRAVVAMVCPLRCEVVAEGYYLSRPLPSEALEQWAGTASWGVRRQDVVAAALALEILRCAQDDRSGSRGGPLWPWRSFAALRNDR